MTPLLTALLLISVMVLPMPANSLVMCGKEWVTFTAVNAVYDREAQDKPFADRWSRYKADFTFRKNQISEVEKLYKEEDSEESDDWGIVTIDSRSGNFHVSGQDYYELIGCLD